MDTTVPGAVDRGQVRSARAENGSHRHAVASVGTGVIDSIEHPIVVIDRDCAVACFNPAAATLLGLSTANIGQPLDDTSVLGCIEDLQELCRRVIEAGTSFHRDIRSNDGSWYSLRAVRYGGSDEPLGAVLTLTSVTAVRASLEQAIHEREYTKSVINTMSDPMMVVDAHGHVQSANQAFYTMFEVSRDGPAFSLYEVGERTRDATRLRALLEGGRSERRPTEPVEIEHQFPAHGQRTLLLHARALSGRDELRRLTLVVVRDVTDQKNSEQALAESEEKLRDFFENSPVALHWAGPDGVILRANRAELALLGYREGEYIGRHVADFHVDGARIEEMSMRLARGEVLHDYESQIRRKDGSIRDVLIDASVLWRHGDFIHARCFTRDVSERKKEDLALANALSMKDEFIGLVSHELRTPITTIMGNAAILVDRGETLDDATRLDALSDVHHEAQRLNAIIEDLLSLARLEQGHVEYEPVALTVVVARCVEEYRRSTGRNIEMRADGERAIVLADETLIGQVVGNYLSNADKYSPHGASIQVVVECADDEARVRVMDRGIGIDQHEADLLFESFYRSKHVRSIGGVGIGLSVCRRLIGALGGRCWAQAREDAGTEFGFTLPRYAADEGDEVDDGAAISRGGHP